MAKRRRARKKTGRGLLWGLICLGVLVFGYVYYNSLPTGDQGQRYQIIKEGAAATADFRQLSHALHQAVDEAPLLKQEGSQVRLAEDRQALRLGNDGTIRWNFREIVGLNIADQQELQRQLTDAVALAGGVVLTVQPDDYEGITAVRFDIGIRDTLGGEPLTIVTDRVYAIAKQGAKPVVQVRGRLALVIDDFGYTSAPIEAFAAIKAPLTFAVLPYRTYSNLAASRALGAGQQVMLHLPVEPLAAASQSEEHTILTTMNHNDIQAAVIKAIQAVPGVIGVNNHQGSRGTADARLMKSVLGVIKQRNLFFIDSRTNSQSIAYLTAQKLNVPSGENNIFLDNEDDIEAVKRQLRSAIKIAASRGQAVAIGHARMNTAAAVQQMLPEFEQAGVQLVFASTLMH